MDDRWMLLLFGAPFRFFVRFLSFCFALSHFLHFRFRSFDFPWFISFYSLSACVVSVLSRFGGGSVLSFVLAFVSVGILHLATVSIKPLLFHSISFGISFGVPPFFVGFRLQFSSSGLVLMGYLFLFFFRLPLRCCI